MSLTGYGSESHPLSDVWVYLGEREEVANDVDLAAQHGVVKRRERALLCERRWAGGRREGAGP